MKGEREFYLDFSVSIRVCVCVLCGCCSEKFSRYLVTVNN